jgi:hypothetical protein
MVIVIEQQAKEPIELAFAIVGQFKILKVRYAVVAKVQ